MWICVYWVLLLEKWLMLDYCRVFIGRIHDPRGPCDFFVSIIIIIIIIIIFIIIIILI